MCSVVVTFSSELQAATESRPENTEPVPAEEQQRRQQHAVCARRSKLQVLFLGNNQATEVGSEACARTQYKRTHFTQSVYFPADVGAREERAHAELLLGHLPECRGGEEGSGADQLGFLRHLVYVLFFSHLRLPLAHLWTDYTLRAMTVLNYPPALCNFSSEASPTSSSTSTSSSTTRP